MNLSQVEHQAARVGRIFGASLGVQLVAYDVLGHATDRKAVTALVVSAVVAAIEATYRQAFPTVPVDKYLTSADQAALKAGAEKLTTALVPNTTPVDRPVPAAVRLDDHGMPIE